MLAHLSMPWSRRSRLPAALIGALLSFPAALPALGPVISSVSVANVTNATAEVSWVTDVPASSQVILMDGEYQPNQRFPEPLDTSLATSHKVVVSNLIPNTQSWYYVASIDASGNLSTSYNISNRATFKTLPVDPAAPFDYRLDVQGAHHVYAGHDVYVEVNAIRLAGGFGDLIWNGASGLPPGSWSGQKCSYYTTTAPNDYRATGFCWADTTLFQELELIQLRIPSSAPLGTYNVVLSFSLLGIPKQIQYPLEVVAPPAAVVKTPITSVPPIPNLKQWETTMTTLGKKWCNPTEVMQFGYEQQIWYYDGGRTFLQMADYLGDPASWNPCAYNIINQYRDYLVKNNGYDAGWRVFPHGLAMSYWRTGDAKAKQAAVLLSQGSPYATAGGRIGVGLMRETAYVINTYVKAEELGQPRNPLLPRAVDFGLGVFDQLFVSRLPIFDQPFYDGLMAEALIQYYALTQDPRVPPAIKTMLDYLWDETYSPTNHAFAYNPLLVPPLYQPVQSNLIVPAYAWYWQLTGDPVYQQRGDDIFAHSLDSDITYSAKIFNQNFRWSFDYVRWRSNNPLATTDPPSPPAPAATSLADGASGVVTDPLLAWGPSPGATSYEVYFGTSSAPPLAGVTTDTGWDPGALIPGVTYYWQVIAKNPFGSTASPVWSFTPGPQAEGLRFVPVTPCRVADTRNAPGPFGGPGMAAGSTRSFAIPQSACGIPATAQAYSLNVIAVPKSFLGYLTLWATGEPQPAVSTLNSYDGSVVANAAIVPAGTGGAVSVFVTDPTQVILDIGGYFDKPSAPGSYSFYAAAPCRIADTRRATGQFGGPAMHAGQTRDFPIPLSSCHIPPTARAYSLNFTVVPQGPLGYLATWPTGQQQPLVSTLNSPTGTVVANAALVPAGTNESISVFVTDPANVVLDIDGYFGQPGSPGALSFYPVTPCRLADTRNPAGPFGGPEMAANTSRSFTIPAGACGVPATAAAYSLNVTAVPDAPLPFLTAWPTGWSSAGVSTLNSWDGSPVANAAIVPAGTNHGSISIFVAGPTQVILDIDGYFAP